MRKITFFVLASLVFFLHVFAEPEDFEAFIERVRKEYHVPGVSVVVVKNHDITFIKGFGQCRIDQSQKVDENTIFQLASVSKTFTATAIGTQVDKKKLKWDDEVIKNLPQFALKVPYSTQYATARDLLIHSTGLPALTGDLLGKAGYTREEVLFRVRYMEPAVSFREKALYSNVGYFAAGELLAKLAGSSFEESLSTLLLKPLKMNKTGFAKDIRDSNVAFPHADVEGTIKVIPRDTSEVFAAAGGLASTAKDMGNWIILHLNDGQFEGKEILKAETIKTMHAPAMVTNAGFAELPPINEHSSLSYTLGWTNYNYKGKNVVEKGGALDGVRAVVVLVPELKVGIAVLANLNLSVLPELIRAKFLEDHIGKYEGDLEKEFSDFNKKLPDLVKAPKKLQNLLPMAHTPIQYTGTFTNELYGNFVVSKDDHESLFVEVGPGHWKGVLTPWGNDSFLLHWPVIDDGYQIVTFVFGPNGEPIEMQTEVYGAFSAVKSSV